MVLDRPVAFDEADLNFSGYQPPRATGSAPAPDIRQGALPTARKRWL